MSRPLRLLSKTPELRLIKCDAYFIDYSSVPVVFPHHNIFSLIILSSLNNVAWTQLVYICLQGNSQFFHGILEARHGQKSKTWFIVKLWSRYLQDSQFKSDPEIECPDFKS